MQDKRGSNGFFDLYRNPLAGNSEPRGYTYVAGYGFSPPPRAEYERRILRTYSSGIALMLLCFLLLSGPVYQLLLSFGQSLFGSLSYDGYTAVSELANMGAYLVALLLPAFLYCRRIRIPRYNAFPLERSRDLRITLAAVPISLMAVVVGSSCASAMGSGLPAASSLRAACARHAIASITSPKHRKTPEEDKPLPALLNGYIP